MELNLNNYKFQTIDAPYPIGFIDNFIDKKNCESLFTEIVNFTNFDDMVMSGRQRVNKGSKNFNDHLKTSPFLTSLYEKLNDEQIESTLIVLKYAVAEYGTRTQKLYHSDLAKGLDTERYDEAFQLFEGINKWLVSKISLSSYI